MTTALSLAGFSQTPGFSVGYPQLDGNGCPSGTARAVVLDDGSTVSIPEGYNLEATSINYQGFADLMQNARGIVMTTGPMSNPMGLTVGDQNIRTEMRNKQGNFSIIQPLFQNFKNICRPIQMIEFNTVIQLFGPNPKNTLHLVSEAQFSIDSGDIGGTEDPIRIKFRVRPCH